MRSHLKAASSSTATSSPDGGPVKEISFSPFWGPINAQSRVLGSGSSLEDASKLVVTDA